MKWFRFYPEVLHDPKVRRLPAGLFKDWVLLLCLASQGKPRGVLPSITDIAYHLDRSPKRASSLLADLQERGLLDERGGDLHPHNWNGRQFESDSRETEGRRKHDEARRKHGARWKSAPQGDGALAAADTDTDTESRTDSEAEDGA